MFLVLIALVGALANGAAMAQANNNSTGSQSQYSAPAESADSYPQDYAPYRR
jgi:hypothetical protein